ncbi:hypothetical protein [Nocardia sp. NPDC051570]|uniref:hypothetical protein n=1 Tax=Nocardia sp. NPDC051570 TaxID=3364324 RepID=UPI0037A68CB5
MSEYFWPEDEELGIRARRAWSVTVAALPIGTRVTGTVIGRQPFGVFIRIDQAPDAVGLIRATAVPPDAQLPPRDAPIVGEVLWHTEHNWQVIVKPPGCQG